MAAPNSTVAPSSSASTTATDLRETAWRSRRLLAAVITALCVGVPVVAAVVVTRIAGSLVEPPGSLPWGIVRWIGLVGVSLLTVILVAGLMRRFLPLAAMFRLRLSFPDTAPSRFKVALRRGSVRRLERELAAGELDDCAGDAANALLALTNELSSHDGARP